jgi:hypothetical protein
MIPDVSRCADGVQAACPGLYDRLAELRDLVYATVQAAVGDLPCGQDLDRAVILDPVAVGPGNHVLVIPASIKMVRPRNAKLPTLMVPRLRVSAVVAVVLEGFPVPTMEGDHVLLPTAEEYDEAAKYVTSIGWCVACAIVEAVQAGNLVTGMELGDDLEFDDLTFSDSGGGQATVSLRIAWTQP